ncbi:MAG: hypothetical protein IH898_10100, partial [Planctomycetes bacterium]|nr:hypothetical protein [Planctomycetota bacterium]
MVYGPSIYASPGVYANPAVKKLLDRTIAKVDSNLNRQEIHYGWAHFESLDSMAFSAKSVSNFKQKLVNLIELGYVPLAPDFYVRGKLRGQLGYSDIEPKFVSVRDNSISADWEEESELFSRWQGVKASPKNGRATIADSRTYQRLTPKGIVEEQGPQCWKYAWSLVRENCGRAVIGDLETGKGKLKISMTDTKAFTLGENVATTPGKVVFQNDLMQLLQYAPSTATVLRRPLLIAPPWINKYYVLDLQPKNSFIKWAVEQGHTVFVISWVNPDETLAHKGFDDYMLEGPLAAMEAVEKATGERQVNLIGYCIGGT